MPYMSDACHLHSFAMFEVPHGASLEVVLFRLKVRGPKLLLHVQTRRVGCLDELSHRSLFQTPSHDFQ